jgi:tetratricopeptide (TPR) repeat protein
MRRNQENPAGRRRWHGQRVAASAALAAWIVAAGCASPEPVTRHHKEMAKITASARYAYERGDLRSAARLYRDALAEARAADDGAGIGESASNAAICLVALKDFEAARPLLAEAKRALERAGGGRPVVVLLVQAQVARAAKDIAQAQTALEKASESLGEEAAPDWRAQIELLRAQIACDRTDVPAAREAFGRATTFLEDVDDGLIRAEAAGVEGRLLLLEGDPHAAARAFDREAGLLKEREEYRRMAHALARAAGAWQDAGESGTACDGFYRAARGLQALGDTAGARAMVERLTPATERRADAETFEQFRILRAELEKAAAAEAPPQARAQDDG